MQGKYLFFCLFLFSISLYKIPNAHAKLPIIPFQQLQLPTEKQSEYGIGVFFLDLQQPNVSLQIRRLDRKSLTNNKTKFLSDVRTLDLSNLNGSVSIHLPAGLYQVVQINIPHFDLPFKLETSNKADWRFQINKEKINYLGTLQLDAIRSKDSIDIVLLNQFATHYDEFSNMVESASIGWPLGHGAGYRDEFFPFLQGELNE